ncbi:hypothetical protein HCU01_29420 [Halomonas cupida]|uniref:Uncharacterized protein n=1 Tax=Halomonas cupida TaxID=44933 RepID=A0A1M7K7W4_9GAMM|nr:hypothetical protein [Halomonas cupida]GEN24993.1 hypothetical protein HCU01_29420 [Halomonas cupida]SHM60937.1 hypothetical protein SAMN05660971_03372 [Halomonas cupida]
MNVSTPQSPRAGATFCVSARCREMTQQTTDESTTLCRLRTDKGVFFFYREQFERALPDPAPGNGEPLIIGAHRLADGSAWLHWFQRADGEIWAPQYRPLRGLLLTLALVFALTVAVFWIPGSATALILAKIVTGLGCVFVTCWTLAKLVVRLHPAGRRLRSELNTLQTSGLPTLSDTTPLPSAAALPLADGIHGDVGIVQGTASEVEITQWSTGSGRSQQVVRRYQLRCGSVQFTLTTPSSMLIQGGFVFRRRAPLFIGEKDPIALLTLISDGEVHGLLNLTDGLAYISYSGCSHSPQSRRVLLSILAFMGLFMTLCLLGITLHDWISRGIGPDYWDWLQLMEFGSFMGLVSLMLFGIGGLVLTFVGWRFPTRLLPNGSEVEKVVALAYQWRLHHGRSPVLIEIS